MANITSIDLGSNSFRVLIYDCKNHKGIGDFETSVGTADGLEETGKISSEAVNRIITAINTSIEKLHYTPHKAIARTTAAMRKASNSQEILDYIKEQTNIDFKIIEPVEEARLTLLAVVYALKRHQLNDKKFILVDIGGGSTELIIKDRYKIYKKSFDVGIVTLSQTKNNIEVLSQYKIKMKEFIDSYNLNLDEFDFISTAGTPTTIAALKLGMNYSTYDKHQINGTKVTLDDLENCLNIFKNNTPQYLENLVGTGRQDYIVTGVNIYQTIFDILEKNSSVVFDDGLREGIAINSCFEH
ncbi:MAG: exopolyphosphatase [Campylobacteraceae bacterium]|nr:exopolyphosphatase [Campylobacteraceae bacterium]